MLKEKLELLSERLRDRDPAQSQNALKMIKQEVAGATSSMTSVPKPLKFLSTSYQQLKEFYLS
jgi:26S proteasome regulatory subunit N1